MTFRTFAKLHLQELESLFVQVLRLCQEAGLVKLGHVSLDVTNAANDKQQAEPLMSQAQENIGKDETIDKASMDSGYFSEANVAWLEENGIDGYVATGRIKHGERVPTAPRGRPPDDLTVKEKMALKLRPKKGRETYSKRKSIVKPVFGQIKRVRGFVQFSLRGLEKMRGEWALVCLTHNLLKLFGSQQTAMG